MPRGSIFKIITRRELVHWGGGLAPVGPVPVLETTTDDQARSGAAADNEMPLGRESMGKVPIVEHATDLDVVVVVHCMAFPGLAAK